MKEYRSNLLSPWPSDATPSCLPASDRVASLFPIFYEEAKTTFDRLNDSLISIGQDTSTDAYETMYRRGHVLSGFAAILNLPKADHLLATLDFALDLARRNESFQHHSLDYLVKMLINIAQTVLEDFHTDGQTKRDLEDVFEECRTYLGEPLQTWLSESQQITNKASTALVERPPETVSLAAPLSKSSEQPETPDIVEVDDAPESIRIPTDKVGLVSDFCEESRDNLGKFGHLLIELEDTDEPIPLVNDLFRSIHTVKGGARLLEVRKIETLAHHMESLLNSVRNGERKVTAQIIDVLLAGQGALQKMVDEVASRGPIRTRILPVLKSIAALEPGTTPPALKQAADVDQRQTRDTDDTAKAEPPTISAKNNEKSAEVSVVDSIRVPTEKLDEVLNIASEVFITRIRLQSDVEATHHAIHQLKQTVHRMAELDAQVILNRLEEANRRLLNELSGLLRRTNGRVTTDRLAPMVNRFRDDLAADLEQHGISAPEEMGLNVLSIEEIRKRLLKNVDHLEQLSARLQSGAMSFRMVPIAQLFDRFPTQVREIARQVGKKAKLELRGGDTELDKVLINQLGDPLLHILRNSVDHGIEPPEERRAKGKPEIGHIKLEAFYHGSHVVIEASDDGRGIDTEHVLSKALDKGLINARSAADLSQEEILDFLFEPGFSTATEVSTLSGRGVGMDVVKTAMQQLQGSITCVNTLGEGMSVRMKLPLTLAVVGIVLVEEGANQFAFPILHVEEILSVEMKQIKRINEDTVYNYRGTTLPVTSVSSILDFQPSLFRDEKAKLVILTDSEKRIGILVDNVLGRQDVLIKNLGRLLKKVPYVMGCTILSDSRLVLILNAWEIVNMKNRKRVADAVDRRTELHGVRKQHRVMVVDDSPIQRRVLSSLLEQAGYTVDTADNGFDALKIANRQRYSAFCVDVTMPLMDGFELVERLHEMAPHRDKPVFVVTSHDDERYGSRAAELGVKAYLEKPVDANELLKTVDRYCLEAARNSSPLNVEDT